MNSPTNFKDSEHTNTSSKEHVAHPTNFIRNIIEEDLQQGRHQGQVITRFPPEPNGYLHIGHAKSICLNFGIAAHYQRGFCYLRFDDTNPATEDQEYIDAIQRDIRWLGFDWGTHLTQASDYFEQLYQFAVQLIHAGKAYVCSQNAEQMREQRGTLTEAGKNSPDRDRSIAENLELFQRMRQGDFADGQYVLRAKIDMQSGNINMRDPAIYRIKHLEHHRTGNHWCIYPLYDFTHCLSDALENITHSLCTLEFQDHRPLYDWFLQQCQTTNRPQQIEFSRLNLNFTITSKRKLKRLVLENLVNGWDDPRLPTLSGLRRRGCPPESIRHLCEQVGVSKQESIIEMSLFENIMRDDLNRTALRRMAVLQPLKIMLSNFPKNHTEYMDLPNHPQQPELGTRAVAFSRELYIENSDFMLDPPKDFFRLAPGRRVRLMNAFVIVCEEVILDKEGRILELVCQYLPETKGGKPPADGQKVKGVIHWVSAAHAVDAEVRLFDRLFTMANPDELPDFVTGLNPNSLNIVNAKLEAGVQNAAAESCFQFNRVGYFCADWHDHKATHPVFNRTIGLKDQWTRS